MYFGALEQIATVGVPQDIFLNNVRFNGTVVAQGGLSTGALQTATINAPALTVTPAAGTGVVLITATSVDAFTIALPAGAPVAGQLITFVILNSSGGVMGNITFVAAYRQTAIVKPASTQRTTVQFVFDGTVWNMVGTQTAVA